MIIVEKITLRTISVILHKWLEKTGSSHLWHGIQCFQFKELNLCLYFTPLALIRKVTRFYDDLQLILF